MPKLLEDFMGIKVNKLDNRFQYQKWYVKLWRLRYYLLIPYFTLSFYFSKNNKKTLSNWLSFRTCWSLSKGIAQSDMKWYYTTEEVFGREDLDGNL